MGAILIVDDQMLTHRVIGHVLAKDGYKTLSAYNGLEALKYLEVEAIDLLISDLAMPEMDGLTLLNEVRNNPKFNLMPIIMLTASGNDHDKVLAKAAGADVFLSKPASSREISEVVARLLLQN
jgi:CheY-like chemotaxis protein